MTEDEKANLWFLAALAGRGAGGHGGCRLSQTNPTWESPRSTQNRSPGPPPNADLPTKQSGPRAIWTDRVFTEVTPQGSLAEQTVPNLKCFVLFLQNLKSRCVWFPMKSPKCKFRTWDAGETVTPGCVAGDTRRTMTALMEEAQLLSLLSL